MVDWALKINELSIYLMPKVNVHPIGDLAERGVERGSARRASFKGRERAIVTQTNIGTVSNATLEKRLRDGCSA